MAIFISYSHKNSKALSELRRFLEPLEKKGLLSFWDDRKITPGMDWKREIDQALQGTSVAVLLICQDFLNSDFIQNHELPYLLEKYRAGRLELLPVFWGVTNGEDVAPELAAIQGYASPKQPLVKRQKVDRDEVLRQLSTDLIRAIPDSATPRPPPDPTRSNTRDPANTYFLNIHLSLDGPSLRTEYALPGREPFHRLARSRQTFASQIEGFHRILDSGDSGRTGALCNGAVDHCGKCLFELLFGTAMNDHETIFRQAFAQPAPSAVPTPVRAPLRLRIATDVNELLRLPWRLLAWNGRLLTDERWQIVTGLDRDPVNDQTTTAPSEVLLLIHPGGQGSPQRERMIEAFRAIWPDKEETPRYLRIADSIAGLKRVLEGQPPQIVYLQTPVEGSARPRGRAG